MEYFNNCGVHNIKELEVLDIVRNYKKVHSLADILWCDGRKIGPDILLTPDSTDRSCKYPTVFHWKPMKKNKDL